MNFNSLTNTAWEPCKEYFNEIKEIKIKNALERKIIIKEIKDYVKRNEKNWPKSNDLINYLQNMFIKWQKFSELWKYLLAIFMLASIASVPELQKNT